MKRKVETNCGTLGESPEDTCWRVVRKQRGEDIVFALEEQASVWIREYRKWRDREQHRKVLPKEFQQIQIRQRGVRVEVWFTPHTEKPWRN